MSQNRREFLKMIAAGAATFPSGLTAATPQTGSRDIVNVLGVGQWAIVRHKEGSQAMTSLCVLKPALGHIAHQGWLALHQSHIANASPKGEDIGDGYFAWRLRGRLEAKGAQPVPPSATARGGSEEAPEDPANPDHWADPRWVIDLKYVSPGYKVKRNWKDYCISHVPYTGTIPIVGRPPCKKKDAEAIWTFANTSGAIYRQSMTNEFGFGMAFTGIARPTLEQTSDAPRGRGAAVRSTFRIELKLETSPEIFLISALPKEKTPEATTGKRRDDEYTFGFPLHDFAALHAILEGGGSKAIPYFDRKNKKPGKEQECKTPIHKKDFDIFCPPAQLDA